MTGCLQNCLCRLNCSHNRETPSIRLQMKWNEWDKEWNEKKRMKWTKNGMKWKTTEWNEKKGMKWKKNEMKWKKTDSTASSKATCTYQYATASSKATCTCHYATAGSTFFVPTKTTAQNTFPGAFVSNLFSETLLLTLPSTRDFSSPPQQCCQLLLLPTPLQCCNCRLYRRDDTSHTCPS